MNVGVYCSSISSKAGGGYTFQAEVLQALSELAETSHHKFSLLVSSNNGFEKFITPGRFQINSLPSVNTSTCNANRLQKWAIKLLGIEVLGKRSGVKSLSDRVAAIAQVVREQNIHVLWCVGPIFEEVPDIPYLATVWDLQHRLQPFFPEVAGDGEWKFREDFFSKYLQRAAIIITGSHTGQLEIERFYQVPSERIKVLPHPTPAFALNPPESVLDDFTKRLGISDGYLFYPAQFWAHKNHANLLLALDILRREHNLTPAMVFVGSDQGNEQHIRRMVADLGLSDQVTILGFVSREELVALYKNAFALVYMTLFGPDNLPPLEAFALGCPVIASEISGAQEQLGDAALLVNAVHPEEIAQTILKLHQDPVLRKTLIERGNKQARQWTSADFTRGIFDVLDEFERIRRCWD